jgi:hypothetical protein
MLEFLSYVGAMFGLYCAVIGAYITLRWGWTGVATIWSIRGVLDQTVRDDVSLILGGER